MGKYILIALKVILPLAAFILVPWAVTYAKPEWRDSYFGTIWVSSTFGLFCLSVVASAIYLGVTNTELTKTKLWIKLFGK